jgi:hypothetical protein
MKPKWAFVALLAISLVTFAQTPATQTPIYVSVSVTSITGTPIPGLTREHFKLLDDSVQQAISIFQEDTTRNEYWLEFLPTNASKDGAWRKLRVSISDPSGSLGRVTVRATSGYYPR